STGTGTAAKPASLVPGIAAIGGKAPPDIRAGDTRDGPVHATPTELQAAPRPPGRKRHAKVDGRGRGIDGQDLPIHHTVATIGVVHPARRAEVHCAHRLADCRSGYGSAVFRGSYIRSSDDYL